MKNPEISIILPCLNEEQAIGYCINEIKQVIKENKLNAEILVVDNGSKDKSIEIIKQKKVKLIHEPKKGYGSAYLTGFSASKGKYLFFADSDATYSFKNIPRFINQLKKGHDFVIGNRFQGNIEKSAMSWSHKHIGNPILSLILRLFFKTNVHDSHCGMRAITKQALDKLNLQTKGMEFASEMVIKAGKRNLKIKELPIHYHKRKGKSKLKSFADAWRHLRFMLLYSPLFLFFIPGLILFLLGISSMLLLYFNNLQLFGITFFYHPMFLSTLFTITGYQLIIFALFAKTYAINHLNEKPIFNKLYKYITIEKASIFGFLLIILGVIVYLTILSKWLSTNFGDLQEIKNSILAMTLIIIGIQTIFSSFMLSILGIKEK